MMKKLLTFTMLLSLCATFLLFTAPAFAVKPGETLNPNGFPSGEHYNLNLNAKKSDYNCTPAVTDEAGNPVYGKVIFIPQDTSSFSDGTVGILMESGKKGPRGAPDCTTLEVVDQCAGFDENPAVLRLPKSEYGYNVYLRAKGKPTDGDENMMIFGRLQYVEDEFGTSLIFLGTLTENGLTDSPLTRPKGKTKAVDISPLFQWYGAICYEGALPVDLANPGDYSAQCCTLTDSDGDGIYEESSCATAPLDEPCDTGQTLLYCTDPLNYQWIFNIGDHVGYFWDVDNNGVRSAQVRFYPVPAP
jgi:hypothetical protein